MRAETLFMVGAGLLMVAAALSHRTASAGGGFELSVRLEEPLLAAGDETTTLRVEAIVPSAGDRLPVVMVLALDVSGSMAGDKLANARLAAHSLVDRMRPGDRVAIVPFAGRAELLGRTEAIDSPELLHAAIDRLVVAGGTCISCGLTAAFETASRATAEGERRVVLLSDGEANEGLVGGDLAFWTARRRGDVTLTSIGLGARFDERTMSALARAGGGTFYFVHNSSVIESVLERELASLASMVATNGVLRLRIQGQARFVPDDRYAIDPAGRTATIELGALRGGERRVFVMRLMSVVGEPTVEAELRASLSNGGTIELAAEASFERTDDLAEALAARDLDVVVDAERLRSAAAVDAAVGRFMAGEGAASVADLRAEAARLRALAGDTGVDALADEAAAVEQLIAGLQGRDTSDRAAVGSCLFERARAEELRAGAAAPYHARGIYDFAETE